MYELVQLDEIDTELLHLLSRYRHNLLTMHVASRIDEDLLILPSIASAIFAKLETLILPEETTRRLDETKQEIICCINPLVGSFTSKRAAIILEHFLIIGRELELHCHTNRLDHTNHIAQATVAIILTAKCLQASKSLYQEFV